MSCVQGNYREALGLSRRAIPGHRSWMGRVVATLVDIAVRARHRIEVRGQLNDARANHTLVVANHRRDTDGPIVGSLILQRRGLRFHGVIPSFVAREDLFKTGFLAEYLTRYPALIRHLAGHINIRPIIEGTGTYPMRRIQERPLGEVLADVLYLLGDLPLEEVVRPSWARRFGEALGTTPGMLRTRDALDERCHHITTTLSGYRKLRGTCFRRLKPFERAIIEAQLARFITLLEAGEIVVLKPEGVVSPDGRLGRPRGALHALINRVAAQVSVLPVSITYDCMDMQDAKVFINIGSEITKLRGLPKAQLGARVMESIRSGCTVTCSQLAAHHLLHLTRAGRHRLSASELKEFVAAAADACDSAGLYVDPRLREHAQCKHRVEGWLQYCLRCGLLYSNGGNSYRPGQLDLPPAWLSAPRVSLLTYLDNELQTTAGRSWSVLTGLFP